MCWYGGSFSFQVICGSLVVRIDAASRPITIHRTTITPLGYIPARHILLYPWSTLFLTRTHACPLACPSLFLLPIFFITTCLITNSQAYLSPLSLRKIVRDLNYCAFELLFFPLSLSPPLSRACTRATRITIRYFSGRDSNYPRRCELLFIGRLYRIYSGRCFFRNFKHRFESRLSLSLWLAQLLALSLFLLLLSNLRIVLLKFLDAISWPLQFHLFVRLCSVGFVGFRGEPLSVTT